MGKQSCTFFAVLVSSERRHRSHEGYQYASMAHAVYDQPSSLFGLVPQLYYPKTVYKSRGHAPAVYIERL
jgi:hypothetical protein